MGTYMAHVPGSPLLMVPLKPLGCLLLEECWMVVDEQLERHNEITALQQLQCSTV